MSARFSRRDTLKLTALAAGGAGLLPALADPPAGAARRNPPKLGLASYSLSMLPVEKVIAALLQLELRCVSLHKNHIPWAGTAEECRSVAQKFRDSGIAVTGSGVIDLPNDEAAVRKAFENARAAGLPVMTCKPAPDAFPLVEKFVREFDLKLAIHNHGPEDKVFPSPADAWKAAEHYDPRIGLCIDVGHAARAGADPVKAIREYGARLYDVHLKDSLAEAGAARDVPVEIGRGRLNIRALLRALADSGYAHVAHIEYEKRGPNHDPVAGLAESVGYTRALLAE